MSEENTMNGESTVNEENTANECSDALVIDMCRVMDALRKVKSGMNLYLTRDEEDAGELMSACALVLIEERLRAIEEKLDDMVQVINVK